MAPNATAAEAEEARRAVVSVLLPRLLSTLTQRKAAGTLLQGSCRAAEVTWFAATEERKKLREGRPAEYARAFGVAAAPLLGYDVYLRTAGLISSMLPDVTPSNMSRELQLSLAAFVASALDLMAQPRELPFIVVDGVTQGVLASSPEQGLALNARLMLVENTRMCSGVDGEALSLMLDAWRRVERSGVLPMRLLGNKIGWTTALEERLAAAAADATVHGLRV